MFQWRAPHSHPSHRRCAHNGHQTPSPFSSAVAHIRHFATRAVLREQQSRYVPMGPYPHAYTCTCTMSSYGQPHCPAGHERAMWLAAMRSKGMGVHPPPARMVTGTPTVTNGMAGLSGPAGTCQRPRTSTPATTCPLQALASGPPGGGGGFMVLANLSRPTHPAREQMSAGKNEIY